MTKNHMKKCLPSLTIQEMHIKMTLWFYLIPVKIVTIKNTKNHKHLWRCGGKGSLIYYWWEYKLVKPLWEAVWRFLKKLKLELPYDSAMPLLGKYSKECMSGHNRDNCIPMLIAALSIIVCNWRSSCYMK
jgi:hypothetical protein